MGSHRGTRVPLHRCRLYEFGETLDKKTRFEEPGIYDDVLTSVNGRWLFASRRFTILQFRSAPIAQIDVA
jgi:hypothetical protein